MRGDDSLWRQMHGPLPWERAEEDPCGCLKTPNDGVVPCGACQAAAASPEVVSVCAACPFAKLRTLIVVLMGASPSHGLCPACYAAASAELDAIEEKRRA